SLTLPPTDDPYREAEFPVEFEDGVLAQVEALVALLLLRGRVLAAGAGIIHPTLVRGASVQMLHRVARPPRRVGVIARSISAELVAEAEAEGGSGEEQEERQRSVLHAASVALTASREASREASGERP
ncbi:hypothetical protein N9109_01130, partial [bacterium]|nr:hypothetical protein [bacterium]